jgi:hypothetical protein
VLIKRSTIFRKLLRQVSSSPCPTKDLSIVAFLVEDACVGENGLSSVDFMLSLLPSFCIS